MARKRKCLTAFANLPRWFPVHNPDHDDDGGEGGDEDDEDAHED